MKKLALAFLFNVLVLCAFAQESDVDYKVHWSEPQKGSLVMDFQKYTTYVDALAYGTFAKKPTVNLKIPFHFSCYNERTGEVEIKQLKSKNKLKLKNEALVQVKGKLFCLSTHIDKKSKSTALYLQNIDVNRSETTSELREVAKLNYQIRKKEGERSFEYILSGDSTKRLIYYTIPEKDKQKGRIGFHVFDHDFRLIWEREIDLPYNNELLDVVDYKLDNNGDVHILVKLFDQKDRSRFYDRINSSYQLLTYTKSETNERNIRVFVQDFFLKDLLIHIDSNNDVLCGGLYSESYETGKHMVKGIYIARIDRISGEVKVLHKDELSSELLTDDHMRKDELIIRKMFTRENGEVVLVLEYFTIDKVRESRADNNTNTIDSKVYYRLSCKDLIVINFSETGELLWKNSIDKLQDYFVPEKLYENRLEPKSFVLTQMNNQLYFLFDDRARIGIPLKEFKSLVSLISINDKGVVNKLFTKDFDYLNTELIVDKCGPRFGNKIFIYGEKKRKYRFGSILLE